MKRDIFKIGVIMVLIMFMSITHVYSQADVEKEKEILLKKQAQAEIPAETQNYIIGPEDVLYIHIWREENLSKTVMVRIDGKISLPLIDEIQASGLTPLQLKDIVREKYKDFIDDPMITVIVMEANSSKVYISGKIKNPGVYRLRSETTIAQIISIAGGFTEWADQSKIILLRKEDGKEKRMTVNYKKIIRGDDLESNIVLKPGDTIIVP